MTPPVSEARVSNRGQTSLPAALRRRWGIVGGGDIAFVDLGEAALVLPAGLAPAWAELRRALLVDGGYERGLAQLDDPDLADQ